ncbi:unnamed protein product, partial [Rotaria sp. Silwood2]
EKKACISTDNVIKRVFIHILTMFNNLKYLNFGQSLRYDRLSFYLSPPTVISSTLLELYVNLEYFSDCLYLLDGRFNQLHTLYVDIADILRFQSSDSQIIEKINQEKLPNLRFFSLYCDSYINVYDELIVPLLHRMLNLEKLSLYLLVDNRNTFIDGIELKKNIINHMSRLNKFVFSICTLMLPRNQTDLRSNEDIQHTFNDLQDSQIISCINYFQEIRIYNECHIYSYPYKFKVYKTITNNFPGNLYGCVREISLMDERPFEHEFFLRIAQSFPLMEKLTVVNKKSQNNKLCNKSKNDNQDLSIIKYPHLTDLILYEVHDDYIEEFLVDMKMCLSNHVNLSIQYEPLKRVTHNFTRNATRFNCAKLNSLFLNGKCRVPKHVKAYFAHTKIL